MIMKRPLALLAALPFLLAGAVVSAESAQPVGAGQVVSATAAVDTDRLVAGKPFRVAVAVTVSQGWHVNSHTPKEDYLIPTELAWGQEPGISFDPPVYPAHVERKFAFSEQPVAVYEGRLVILGTGSVAPDAAPGRRTLHFSLDYQPCNESQCLAPTRLEFASDVEVAPSGTTSAPANQALFPAPAGSQPTGTASGPGADPFGGKSLPLLLGLVFVSGLALNLTPCVYPLIPITVGFFGRQAEGKGTRTFALALAYVLGMSVTYSALGVFAALSGSLFGVWLQKPIVIVAIAAIVLGLALSMFGLYEIQVPHFISDRTGSRSGVFGAATMGLFVGFVAAPCIGPFVLTLLTYVASKGSAPLGLLLFFTLAMGLGLPYLALGVAAGGLKKLPRSGEWMVSVRKLFGFILVALAIYFLRPLLPEKLADPAIAVPLAAGALYFLFFEKSAAGWFRAVKATFVVALLASAVLFALPRSPKTGLVFAPYGDPLLREATAAGKPVLIDFFATWCLPCKELDEKTFTDPSVVEAARGWVCLKVDLTRESPEVTELKKRWKIQGVPTIVFVGSDGKESAARVVGFEPPDVFVKRLRK